MLADVDSEWVQTKLGLIAEPQLQTLNAVNRQLKTVNLVAHNAQKF